MAAGWAEALESWSSRWMGYFITAQNKELWCECNEETIKSLTKCRAREKFNYPQEPTLQNLEFFVDLNMPGSFSVKSGFWRMSLEMQEGLGMLRRREKKPAVQLSSVVWWQSSGRSPGLERRFPSRGMGSVSLTWAESPCVCGHCQYI